MKNNEATKIYIVSKDVKQAECASAGLKGHGLNVSACFRDLELAEEFCRDEAPKAVVVEADLLLAASTRTLSSLAGQAVIMLSEPGQAARAIKTAQLPIDSLVLKPIDTRHLAISIGLALKNRQNLVNLAQDAVSKNDELAQRKVVEQAKGILMSKTGWDPLQAEDYLCQQAESNGISLGSAAKSYIADPEIKNKAC